MRHQRDISASDTFGNYGIATSAFAFAPKWIVNQLASLRILSKADRPAYTVSDNLRRLSSSIIVVWMGYVWGDIASSHHLLADSISKIPPPASPSTDSGTFEIHSSELMQWKFIDSFEDCNTQTECEERLEG